MQFNIYTTLVVLLTLIGPTKEPVRANAHRAYQQDDWSVVSRWEQNAIGGIPFRVGWHRVHKALDRRDMFLLVEGQFFTHESLVKLFTGLSAEHPDPEKLSVVAYSDKTMLQKAIANNQSAICVISDGSVVDSDARRKNAADRPLYPAATGYFRAYYFRSRGEEVFRYSPTPSEDSYITVTIRAKQTPSESYTGQPEADLILAARKGDFANSVAALAAGANVNVKTADGRTALHLAVIWERTDVSILLMQAGVDVNARDIKGVTPLMFAADGDPALLNALLRAGADVNAKDNSGDTVVMYAVLMGQSENLRTLIAAGAKVDERDADGATPLMFATGSARMLQLLIAGGANVNAQDKDGCTALMLAAKRGDSNCVQLLLGEGADVNLKSKSGETALKLARKYHHARVSELLSAFQSK